jgi:guanylate kinase
VHYHFVSVAAFDEMIATDELLEWALVHGNRYGVPKSSVSARLESGGDVVCIIEVQGALNIRRQFPDSLLVFLKPPPGRETEVLKARIENRGAEDEAQIERRLQTASWEMTQTSSYDYEIINERVEDAARELCEIVEREKARNR